VVIPRGDPGFASLLRAEQIPFQELDLVRLRRTANPAVHIRFLARFGPNVAALRRLIREHHIDVVHTNGLMHTQAAIAARLEGVPLVWHLNDVYTPGLLRAIFLPLVRSWAGRIAVSARAVARYYFPDPSGVEDRLHLLYAPVDTGRFSREVDGSTVRQELGIDAHCPVAGTVANLCPGKGIEYLLEAAPRIKAYFPATKFLVVGERLENRRGYWRSLLRRAEELGLAGHIFFTGHRRDIPQVMRAMTVYVHPSESEACPMAVLEASASGLPVVATNVGGIPELVEDGATGILVEPRRPSQIAEAVVRLIHSPGLARGMGVAGAERTRRLFSLDRCVEEHVRLYNAVLSRAGSG